MKDVGVGRFSMSRPQMMNPARNIPLDRKHEARAKDTAALSHCDREL